MKPENTAFWYVGIMRHPLLKGFLAGAAIEVIRAIWYFLYAHEFYFSYLASLPRCGWHFTILSLDFAVPCLLFLWYNHSLDIYAKKQQEKVIESIRRVKATQDVSILGFTKITEARDRSTGNHVIRMAHYCRLIADALRTYDKYKDYITSNYVDEIFISAPLHDIGKVGIKDGILLKEGKLSPEEFEIMKMHTIIGGGILSEMERKLQFRTYFTLGKEIAFHHHQRWDGTGYPSILKTEVTEVMVVETGIGRPLKAEEIPLSARIVALSDVYDALVSRRVYKDAFDFAKTQEIILKERGKHFDPVLVDVYLAQEEAFKKIKEEYND